jgi:hypothetical protein
MNNHEYPFMVACLCASRLLFLKVAFKSSAISKARGLPTAD